MGQIFTRFWRHAPPLTTAGLLGVAAAGAAGKTQPSFVPHAVRIEA